MNNIHEYKKIEAQKILTILHVVAAISTAMLYKMADHGALLVQTSLGYRSSLPFILAIIFVAGSYAFYTYVDLLLLEKISIDKRRHEIPCEKKDIVKRIDTEFRDLFMKFQFRTFLFTAFAWIATILGLSSFFLLPKDLFLRVGISLPYSFEFLEEG